MPAPFSRHLLHALRDERGTALLPAIIVVFMLLTLTGMAFAVSQQLGDGVKRTSNEQRAFAAADAGLDRALQRLNQFRPVPDAQCVTDVVATASGGWCAASPAETLGNDSSFTYRVSVATSPVANCGGVTLSGANGDRCVVATGTVGGVSRRVAARVAVSTNSTVFASTTSVVGYKQVRIKRRAIVNSNISTNGKLQVENGATMNGNATLGPKAKLKGTINGTTTRLTAPLVPTLPDFSVFDPASGTKKDTATWNDNGSALAPFSGSTKITYDATTRVLTVADGAVLTLPPGVYNFCKLTLGKNAKVTIVPPAAGATVPKDAVRLFLDTRDRAGSRCATNGGLDSKTGSSFVNTAPDPRTLQIFAWSKKTNLKVGNAVGFSGIIYAPNSKVKFNSKGKLNGGVAGQTVEIRKEMQVVWNNLLTTWTAPDSGLTQNVSWRQCSKTAGAAPYDGCPAT